nr:hypothetical protein GCM10020093_022200 [Planobispora longispora]
MEALADPDVTVLATPAALVAAGPGWFQRVIEAVTPTEPPAGLREIAPDPRRWPGWWWGLLVGLGMIVAGLGAALITIGPLLLWYDEAYLGMDRHRLDVVNHRLAPFLQHDRITMAGTMVAIGVLYAGLAWGGLRQGGDGPAGRISPPGWSPSPLCSPSWAPASWSPCTPRSRSCCSRCSCWPPCGLRNAPVDGAAGGTGAAAAARPHRPAADDHGWSRAVRRGAVISVVGLTEVFVSTDLAFLGTDPGRLDAASPGWCRSSPTIEPASAALSWPPHWRSS